MAAKESLVDVLRYLVLRLIISPIDYILDTLQGYFTSSKTPNRYLSGNYAPVHKECKPYPLPITQGAIPSDLAGEFVRNGPNSSTIPQGGYHWFDGDGMLHGVRIKKDGTVSYINRQIQTDVLREEQKTGMFLRVRIGEMRGILGLIKVVFNLVKRLCGLNPNFNGTANTAVMFHNNKLQALVENDAPYEIQVLNDGQFETAGRLSYGGLSAMTAHPKIDPVTNELFFFSYLVTGPFLTYGYADPSGKVVRTFDINIPKPVMMHDFAITERYALFLDLSLVFDVKGIVLNGGAFSFDKSHPARVGIMDRYAKNPDGIIWFPVSPCFVFHTANAWEEGDEVVLYSCVYDHTFRLNDVGHNPVGLAEWRFNMKTKEVKQEMVAKGVKAEFPQINFSLLGRKNKYVYSTTGVYSDITAGHYTGLIKVDLETKQVVQTFVYGANKYGGEAVFVPKANAKREDDGYLLAFVYDQKLNKSSFWVMDARTMTDIVAIVDLPQRVPYGFHGIFMSEADIQAQKYI